MRHVAEMCMLHLKKTFKACNKDKAKVSVQDLTFNAFKRRKLLRTYYTKFLIIFHTKNLISDKTVFEFCKTQRYQVRFKHIYEYLNRDITCAQTQCCTFSLNVIFRSISFEASSHVSDQIILVLSKCVEKQTEVQKNMNELS